MKHKILMVDDEKNILNAFQRNLRGDFEVVVADSPELAINIFKEKGPFAVIVSDYRMPKMNGIELLSLLKKIDESAIRIILTGQADMETAIKAVNEGSIFRFLTKPCEYDFLKATLNSAIEQYELVQAEKTLLEKTLKGSIKVLIDLLAVTNPLAFNQSLRLRALAKNIADRLNVKNMWEVEIASMLSQIGCITIPTEIFNKVLSGIDLNDKEIGIFMRHPKFAYDLLINIPRLEDVATGIYYQNKNYDGTGFPVDELKGKSIPFLGRLLRVIIDYDLHFEKLKSKDDAFSQIKKNVSCYDPDIIKALEAEVLSVERGFIVREITLKELMTGMVLADDIKNENGITLVAKNFEISDVIKTRLLNYAKVSKIIEPIKILDFIKP